MLDGNGRAVDPAAILCTRELLGLPADTPALQALAAAPVLNSRGAVVGALEARLA